MAESKRNAGHPGLDRVSVCGRAIFVAESEVEKCDRTEPVKLAWRDRVSKLLDDPIVHLVMRRDGITRDDVFDVMEKTREGLHARLASMDKPAVFPSLLSVVSRY
ncbi:hypothetical protein CCP2SC5_70017 [Azospirillaceae bacterium]